MANRVRTVSIDVEVLDKKNAYIKELEVRLRLATSPERAKQLRDHVDAMKTAIETVLAKACRGTRAMQITQQLCVPQECLDAARKAMQEPAIEKTQTAGDRATQKANEIRQGYGVGAPKTEQLKYLFGGTTRSGSQDAAGAHAPTHA